MASSKRGFPDLVLARDGVVILAELKTERGTMTPEQKEWWVAGVGHLWKPRHAAEIIEMLRRAECMTRATKSTTTCWRRRGEGGAERTARLALLKVLRKWRPGWALNGATGLKTTSWQSPEQRAWWPAMPTTGPLRDPRVEQGSAAVTIRHVTVPILCSLKGCNGVVLRMVGYNRWFRCTRCGDVWQHRRANKRGELIVLQPWKIWYGGGVPAICIAIWDVIRAGFL